MEEADFKRAICSIIAGTLVIPGGIPCLIEMIQELCLPGPVLFMGKILLALPASYHTLNGFRHLVWFYISAL